MMRQKWIILLLVILSVKFCFAGLYPAGFDALFIKDYAPAQGMAEAYTSIKGDTGSLFYNPAGLAKVSDLNIGLNHYSGLFESKIELLTLANPVPFGVVGIGFNYFYLPSDKIYDGDGIYLFDAKNYDLIITGGFGKEFKEIGNGLRTGVNLKFGIQKVVDKNNFLFAIDIGGIYEIKRDFLVGLSVKDIGIFPKGEKVDNSSPANLNFGVNHRFLEGKLLGSFDFSYYFYGQTYEKIGVEYTLLDIIFLRTGYKIGYDTGNLSFGVGILYRIKRWNSTMKFNYSFNLNTMSSEFGQVHCINCEILLPKISFVRKKRAIKRYESWKGIYLSIAKFKNIESMKSIDYLKEQIPEKTSDIIEMDEENIRIVDIINIERKPTLELLNTMGVDYVVGGNFSKKENLINLNFFIVDVKTKEKIFKDSFTFDINVSHINKMYEELAKRIISKIKEIKKEK